MKKTLFILSVVVFALAMKRPEPKPDAFQSDIEAIFGDSTGYAYQYYASCVRKQPDSATKLSAFVSSLQALESKYGGFAAIHAELTSERRQPWNVACNVLAAGLFIACKAGCHVWGYNVCIEYCTRWVWAPNAAFCNQHFPAWPDLNSKNE